MCQKFHKLWLPVSISRHCIVSFFYLVISECPVCRATLPDDADITSLSYDDYTIKKISKLKARCRWSVKWKKINRNKVSLSSSLDTDGAVPPTGSPTVKSLDDLMLRCLKRQWIDDENGCHHVVELGNIVQHHLECKYKPGPCENEGCNASIPYFKMEEHLQECPQSLLECSECHDTYFRKDEDEHQNKCKKGKMTCRLCSICVERENIRSHIKNDCPLALGKSLERVSSNALTPNFIVQCPHSTIGCSHECSRESMGNHLESCPYEALKGFISTTLKKIDACEKKIRSQQETIARLEWTIESHHLDRGEVDPRIDTRYNDDYY